jgi:hypothetical protein
MSGRCSTTQALNLLIPAFAPIAAADELTRAIHGGLCWPICNGVKVKSHILGMLRVVARLENDGRWTACVKGSFPMGGVLPDQVWEFEIDEVKGLLPQPELERPWPTVSGSVNWSPPAILAPATPPPKPDPTPESPSSEIDRILEDLPRRPVGRLPKHDWQAIHAEIARRCIDPEAGRVKLPKSERRLAKAMLDWCRDKYNKEPAESEMREAVQTICAALRPLQK